jgi:hypothetical protein
MQLLFASDFSGLAWIVIGWFLMWLAIATVFGFGCAAVLAVYLERKSLWWTGIPLTIGWVLLFWMFFQASQR